MGPTILLDKCALQSLGREEINSLASTFCVNAPPILIEEIVADLKKSKGLMKDARHEVEVLARKLRACLGSIYINVHYRVLCEGEVLGYEVKMDRLTLIGGGKRVMLPEGGFGVVFDEPADQARLRRWAEDEFTAEDEVLAERWRSASAKLNLDASVTEARRSIKGLPKPTTLSEVSAQVDRYLETGRQYHFVCEAMERLGFGRSTRDKAMLRWRIQNHSSFRRFAPYTFIVYRTIMIYAAGLVLGLIGTRSTNCLDLEYLFYLPFSKVFCSGDQFLVEMAPVLLEPDQLFIGREMLRFDMKAISNVRKAETEVQREAVISGFSSGPNRPFSHALWNLIPRPWEQKERDLEFTEEGEKWLQNQIKQWTSTIEKASEG